MVSECVETYYWGDANGLPLFTDPIQEAQHHRHNNLMYERDSDRREAKEDDLYFGSPLAYTASVWNSNSSRITKRAAHCRIYLDKGMHGRNLLKTAKTIEQVDFLGMCPLCKQPDSQKHWLMEFCNSGSRANRERTNTELIAAIEVMSEEARAKTPWKSKQSRSACIDSVVTAFIELLRTHQHGYLLRIGRMTADLFLSFRHMLGDDNPRRYKRWQFPPKNIYYNG